MDPLSIVASTISILDAASKTYKVLLRIRGLPREFAEVERTIPLAEDVLRKVHGAIPGLDDQSRNAIQPTASDCQERATKLRDILDRLNNDPGSKENGALDVYRKALRRLGKSHRVESLMSGLLRGLDKLAQHQLFATATEHQLKDLQAAIEKLGKIESSVPDSDLEGSAVHMEQHIAQGGTGQQMQIGGEGHYINTGSAPQYISGGGNMYFGVEDAEQSAKNELEKKRMAIFQLLIATADHRARKERNPPAVQGTCAWFIKHPYFTSWRESEDSEMLFVSANPGCGKSVLANHLVNKRLGDSNDSRIICHYFFKDDFEDQKNAIIALQCILLQLFSERRSLLSGRVIELFDMAGITAGFSLHQLWEILITALRQADASEEIVCLIDAYDECSAESGQKEELSALLRNFYASDNELRKKMRLKFLITSRFNMKTKQDLMLGIEGVPIIFLQGESSDSVLAEISAEVNLYIEHEVSLYRQNFHLTNEAAAFLLEILKSVENRTYLWVYLIFKYICEVAPRSKEEICGATASLPETVDEAYERILKQSCDSSKARRLLHIIVAAERPLTLAEMQIAMAIRDTDRCYEDLSDRLVSEKAFRESINGVCGLFITIFEEKIYLIHQTAKEFLVSDEFVDWQRQEGQLSSTNSGSWKASLEPQHSHRVLAGICLTNLLFNDIGADHQLAGADIGHNKLNPDEAGALLSEHLKRRPFLAYSSHYWIHHFHHSDLTDNSMLGLLLNVCDTSTSRCQTWFRVFWTRMGTSFPSEFTTTMMASYFNLPNVVDASTRNNISSLKQVDGTYQRSALSWAAENGCEQVVKLLITPLRMLTSRLPLMKRIEVDREDIYGRTALSYAAWRGHTRIAKRLIYAGASVNLQDKSGCTPFQYALCAQKKETVHALAPIASNRSIEIARQELLISAAKSGNQAVVRWLLEENTPTEAVNGNGFTALWEATLNAHYATAQVLLEFRAAPDTHPTQHGSSIFCFLVREPQWRQPPISLYDILLDSGAEIDATDVDGYPAHYLASYRGHFELLDKLHNRGANLNAADRKGNTALMMTTVVGDLPAVQKLLSYKVDVDAKNEDGFTALMLAVIHDEPRIAQQLLCNNADVSLRDSGGSTALYMAIYRKNFQLIRLLLRADEEVGMDTVLRRIIKGNHALAPDLVDRIRRLKNDDGCLPLHAAVRSRQHDNLVELLKSNDIDKEARDSNYQTALEIAIHDESWRCATVLVEYGANTQTLGLDDKLQLERARWLKLPNLTILCTASSSDRRLKIADIPRTLALALDSDDVALLKSAIRRLLLNDDLFPSIKQVLCHLIELRDASRIEMLLTAAQETDIMSQMHLENAELQAALEFVVRRDNVLITKALLKNGAAVNSVDTRSGCTPLHLAAMTGGLCAARVLLRHRAATEVFNRDGHTPLWLAVERGSCDVVKELLKYGARRDVHDSQGRTLLEMAESMGSQPIISMLKEGS